ncbi:phospholipase effector Tle1 domain-containing protein [Novosphingobium sp. CECT 9465]|uniref:phospholipase effector Tle1 domain-containing protein n=1 Tax=Novosphingobium sp. CECT 9465 TaxID=2829794 RepID=UPI0035302802
MSRTIGSFSSDSAAAPIRTRGCRPDSPDRPARTRSAHLAEYALKAYKRAHREDRLDIAWQFRRVIGGRRVPIHFLGVWDTVASVFVRPGLLRFPSQSFLPYTKSNPSIRVFRQAAAIDERRRMFRALPLDAGPERQARSVRRRRRRAGSATVWFAGDHSDVGRRLG